MMANPFDQFDAPAAPTGGNPTSTFDKALAAEKTSGPAADFARSIYQQESSSGANTKTSKAGATGGMQIIPPTFKSVADPGWDINNPEHNARAGIRYATQMFNSAGGDPALAGAGYYGGPGGMAKARQGIAVSDPRNPNAPNTLQYGQQVASRVQPHGLLARAANAVTDAIIPSANAATPQSANPFDQFDAPASSATAPKQTTPATPQAAPNPTDGNSFVQNTAIGIGKAFTDLGQGVGQRLRSVTGDSLGNTLGLPTQADVDEKRRLDAPLMQTSGGKVGNFVGNAAPALATALIPGAQGLAGSMVTGAILGGVAPTATGESVLGNTAAGAAGGLAGYGIGKGIARVVSPNASTNAQLQLLKDEGVKPTIGQTLGGAWNTAEQKLQSVPILGDAITSARAGTRDQLNTAAFNRALSPIGKEAQAGIIGRDGVQSVKTALGDAYNKLIPNLQFKTDPQFGAEMTSLSNMVANGNVPPKFATQFNNIIKNEVTSRMTPQGAMDGQSFKNLESSLGQKIKDFSGSMDPDQRSLSNALQEVLNSARSALSRSNPQYADQLTSINKGYANYATIRRAASGVGANEGVFTPAQLQSAVRAGDKSAGKGAFATGNGLMQDLSEAGKTVLGNNYPDSGTAGRVMGGLGALATGALHPAIPATLLAGAGAYTKPVQSILNAAVSSRPEIAQPIGGAISKYAGALAPSGAQLGVGAFQKKQNP